MTSNKFQGDKKMKPVVGIGSDTKYGKVVEVHNGHVVVEDEKGVKGTVSFRRIEKYVDKENK